MARFTRAERWVHWTTAALMATCLATAAALYVGPVSVLVGHRHLVSQVHVYAGFGLPVPMLLGWASGAYRRDLSRINRFTPHDWEWLRSRDRRSGRIPVGKFNAGQKLNASFTAGAILVMLGTGLVMRYATPWPVAWRTGATFVHDWLAFAIFVVLCGHIWYASRDPVARTGMQSGFVPVDWARAEHGSWAEERPAEETGGSTPR